MLCQPATEGSLSPPAANLRICPRSLKWEPLPGTLTLPNGATIATSYDFMARLTNTTLRTPSPRAKNRLYAWSG